MKKTLFILAALVSASLISCVKENAQDTPETVKNTVYTLTVKASKGSDSKALAADGSTTWASGEKVLVFKEGSATSIGTLNPQSYDAATAQLKGEVNLAGVSEGDKLDLLFIGKDADNDKKWTYDNQIGTLESISDNYDYAKAQVTVSTMDGDNASTTDANFDNQQSIVKFTLKDSDGSSLSATKFVISAASGKLVKSYSKVGDKFEPVYGDIEVTPGSATDVIYVALRNESGSADRYLMTATSSGVDYVLAKSGVTFSNGTLYQKSIKLYGIGTYTIVGNLDGVLDWNQASSTNDLSLITQGEDIGKYGIDLNVTTSAAFEYKIIQNHEWTPSQSWPSYGADPGNYTYGYKTAADKLVPGANTLHVVFDPGAGSIAFYPEAAEYTVLGTFIGNDSNNWNASYTATNMTKQSDGTYTYKHSHVEPGTYEYKVVGNHSWDWDYGVSPHGNNCSYTVTSPCDLIFKFNYRTGAITVEESYPTVTISLTDSGFADWANAYAVAGDETSTRNGIVTMKAVGDSEKMYVYLEIKNANLNYSEDYEYSNILTIYMCGSDGVGTSSWSYWNQMFTKYPNIWIIKDHVLSFMSYDISDLESYSVLDSDSGIIKVELSIPRSYNSILSSDTALIGVIINSQYVQGGSWLGSSDATGVVPAKYSNMYKVFFQ